jgi:RNA polymerase-binding transcription factor
MTPPSAAGARDVLEAHRRKLSRELAGLTAVPSNPPGAVSFGKRIGDGTTEAVERISTTAAARSIAAKAEQVERAIAKVDEGSYGRCDVCEVAIPDERLEAMPWATRCVTHSRVDR